VLLDAGDRRATFLTDAIETLDLGDRVQIVQMAAEEAGRDHRWRARFDLVVARGFGPPAVVAECAAPFLRQGGRLVVSEPPAAEPSRWPREALAELGLADLGGTTVRILLQERVAPEEVPRRAGVPARRPRW
jgi:16S rRNA (guanine527-N7)-methyltransferase